LESTNGEMDSKAIAARIGHMLIEYVSAMENYSSIRVTHI
jgi:hypothetical protein